MYEKLREIGGNYKMAETEFNAKIVTYKKQHASCEPGDCKIHAEIFFKKIILASHINRLPK